MNMNFTGENLLLGQIGSLSVSVSLCCVTLALVLAAASLIFKSHKHIRRAAWSVYIVHVVLLATALGALIMLLAGHNFAYAYAWKYTSVDLPSAYVFSALWAGREGSLLLWAFLSALCGLFLLHRRIHTLALVIFTSFQALMVCMISGLIIPGISEGLQPFILLRETPEFITSELNGLGDYLRYITDGNGLNPLLQNPWMVIHPPVLFLGYALCGTWFALAVTALFRPADDFLFNRLIRMSVAVLLVLGAGLILGGVWAYEDLTFGGFWAWDPVENASLVPWLLSVAALHFLLAARANRQLRNTALFFSALPFTASLYASWLTRSGVLKSTSVHAFAGDFAATGLASAAVLSICLVLAAFIFAKKEPRKTTPDPLFSKEFFLFLAASFFILSAFQIFFTTSFPVINLLVGINLAPPQNPVAFYNAWQLPFVVVLSVLLAISSFLNYGANPVAGSFRKLIFPALASLVTLIVIALTSRHSKPGILTAMFFVLLSLFSVLDQQFRFRHLMRNTSASVVHAGWALFLFAVMFTFSGEAVINRKEAIPGMENFAASGSVPLVKGEVVALDRQGYISYAGRIYRDNNVFYRLDFLDLYNDKFYLRFSLFPSVKVSGRMGNAFLPDTRHLPAGDVFTYISDAGIVIDSFNLVGSQKMLPGDTMITRDGIVVRLENQEMKKAGMLNHALYFSFLQSGNPAPDTVIVDATDKDFVRIKNSAYYLQADSISRDEASLSLFSENPDYVVVKARWFPLINLLWAALSILAAGLVWSLLRKTEKKRGN